ncbi:hypothetical protein [Halomonas alkaliantarctica]|uniref:hypothetical protein n=1 Tax=Halomonas alkaliantarctica TaxID=232346 RepID=UPI0012EB4454|nr:hypothetical protein [Halomonas alkaliantarctica]
MKKSYINKDFSRFSYVVKSCSLEEFKRLEKINDGVYCLPSGETTLDILVDGLQTESHNHCLVFFSGALARRDDSYPPYFSGIKISKELGMPFISISDPTIDLDEEILLGWYAGNSNDSIIQEKVTMLLEHVAITSNFKFIIMGGSGGGFAALDLSRRLASKSITIVWNPQISIENYLLDHVIKYLEVAFPDTWLGIDSNMSGGEAKAYIKSFFEERGITNTILGASFSAEVDVVYLQNKSDWHMKSHLRPFFNERSWSRVGVSSFFSEDGVGLYIGDWAKGHAPPPRNLVKEIIGLVVDFDMSAKNIAGHLSNVFDKKKTSLLPVDVMSFSPEVSIFDYEDFWRISVDLSSILKDLDMCGLNYEVAVYAYKRDRKVGVFWYQKKSFFDIPKKESEESLDEVDAVKVFVRDVMGNGVNKLVPVYRHP